MEVRKIMESMEYGPAPESRENADKWLDKFDRKLKIFIANEWRDSETYFDSIEPGTGKVLTQIAAASDKDVEDAIQAAKGAQQSWADLGGHGRARYLYAIARQIQKHQRLFSVLESLDNGKPIRESRDIDIPLVARHFYHHAGWAQLMDEKLKDYQPLGVIGAIVPWNFPLLIFSWKVAPALAMGNTLVIKPAKLTSVTALLFAEICKNVGLPSGVINIVPGSGRTVGEYIVNHPDIAKVTFTGSTEVGKHIRKSIAGSGKKSTMELGGKSPYIVFEDADIDSAIEGLVDAIWFNQGQVCCAGSRLLIQENIAKDFIEMLKQRMSKLRVGNPLDKAIDIGAVVDKNQFNTIDHYVKIGEDEGGSKFQPTISCPDEGFYYPPTLFTDISPADTLAQEEIFGPILVSMTFRTPEEAVKLANNSRYGLAASIWTENLNLALDIAPKVKSGVIWVNSTNLFDAAAGFGGYKESGFGREGGIEGLYDFVKPKWEKEFRDTSFVSYSGGSSQKTNGLPGIDRTAKMYIGGKQVRPDGNYSYVVYNPAGERVGEASEGNRKDIRNAVEATSKSSKWRNATSHNRAQVIYYIAENLIQRKNEFIDRLVSMTGMNLSSAEKEVDLSIERIYYYAAMADKYDGAVHHTPMRNVTLAMNEPVGSIGIVCPEGFPLLGFVSTVIPAIAMGNNTVVIPSFKYPLAATDFYQILETSDLPAGTINIVTGDPSKLTEILAKHYDLEGLWYFAAGGESKMIEFEGSENMKRTWVDYDKHRDWFNPRHGMGLEFIRRATEVKNIWVPYGV